MKRLLVIALAGFVSMVVFGCARGPVALEPGSTDRTTTERASAPSFVRVPVHAYGNTDALECLRGAAEGGSEEYGEKVGSEAGLVEHARRRFSERIEEGDAVELVASTEGTDWGGELRKVRVVREGRVVALFYYPEAYGDGGWALDTYGWCSEI